MTENSLIKRLAASKGLSITLDCIGIFSAASFLLVILYQDFFIKLIPNCYTGFAVAGFIKCEGGFFIELFGAYLHFFSPLSIGILILAVYGLGVSLIELKLLAFFFQLIYILLAILAVFTTIRILFKTLRKFIKYKLSSQIISSLLILFLIALPSLMARGVKMTVMPSESSGKMINVDMWHAEFSMPRKYLDNWSITDIKRPSSKPSAFIHHLRSGNTAYPFAVFDVTFEEIKETANEKSANILNGQEGVRIRVSPHYDILSEQDLFAEREKFIKGHIKRTYNEDKKPIYDPPYKTINDWELYKPNPLSVGFKADIYVARNEDRQITNILECVPDDWCIKYIGDVKAKTAWQYNQCKTDEECQNCPRVCTDKSYGTGRFLIGYSFDKKYMDQYFEYHKLIIEFVESFITKERE